MDLLAGADQLPDENADRAELLNKWKDKSAEELLKAKIDSDLYIRTLERQKDELREDYLKQREELLAKAKFEEYLDRMEKTSNPDFQAPPAAKEVESPKLDLKELEGIVKKEIQETRIRERQEANFKMVQDKLKEHFGNNYASAIESTGLSGTRLGELAMESPEAVYRLMGVTGSAPKESFQAPPRSGQRSDNFAPRGQVKRDYAFYQEMKKTNPKMALDPKIAVQMHNDVIEMGEAAFYGPN